MYLKKKTINYCYKSRPNRRQNFRTGRLRGLTLPQPLTQERPGFRLARCKYTHGTTDPHRPGAGGTNALQLSFPGWPHVPAHRDKQ